MLELGHTVQLEDDEEILYSALSGSGHLDSHMVTLAAPGDGNPRPPEWFRKNFHNLCAVYHREYDERPQWHMTLNCGYFGNGQWSAHVTWVNEVPRGVEWIVARWNEVFGTKRAVLSPHSNGLRYAVKNMGQPDARTYSGVHNRRMSRKRGKGYLTRVEVEKIRAGAANTG
jgi:hypothetical protein